MGAGRRIKRRWIAAPGIEVSKDFISRFTDTCVTNSEYINVHGGRGDDFVDFDHELTSEAASDRKDWLILNDVVARLERLCRPHGHFDKLAFIESSRGPVGLLPVEGLLSTAVGVPAITVRPSRRVLGLAIKPFASQSGARILIVTDVATTGSSILDAAAVLWRVGAKHVGAFAIADRIEGAAEQLESAGISFERLVIPDPTEQSVGEDGARITSVVI